MTGKYQSYFKTFLKILLVAGMAVVIPMSCAGGGSDEDIPKPQPTPQPQPQPEPEPDIVGLETIMGMTFQVDQEFDLLSGITLNNGASLEKAELVLEGITSEIADPHHFTPEYPGTCTIILTVKDKDGKSTPYQVENLTIKPINYKTMEITNIKPEEILPIVGQVEFGDKEAYKHIEHLRIAEATRIRDMMREYGAGNHNAEEYQKLMNRLNTGMLGENPTWYDNYEIVGGELSKQPSDHAQVEWNILNTLVKHANFKVINRNSPLHERDLYSLCKNNPNSINIIGLSVGSDVGKAQYDARHVEEFKEYDKEKNWLVFIAGGNVREKDGIYVYKTYQEDYQLPDEHSVYGEHSRAHNKNDKTLDRHLMVTFGTNKDGNVDVSDIYGGSKFPIGFHNKILFAGRAFPFLSKSNNLIMGEGGNYDTSYTNYLNVAMMDLCFQMFAEVKDVDELLEMVRSTSLTDYINLDGETQPLQLINPAGFLLEYLMPTDLPASIKMGETVTIKKGYYKGVVFNIPGAEVKIGDQWIAYDDKNKRQIHAQNPMTLEWRLNAKDYLRKLGYKKGNTLTGQIIVVDDQWHGQNLTKDFSITLTE